MSAIGVEDQRSRRNQDFDVLPVASGAEFALTVLTPFGSPMLVTDDIGQTADITIDADNDVPTAATVATIGSATRDIRFAAEAQSTITSVTGFAIDRDSVDEHVFVYLGTVLCLGASFIFESSQRRTGMSLLNIKKMAQKAQLPANQSP